MTNKIKVNSTVQNRKGIWHARLSWTDHNHKHCQKEKSTGLQAPRNKRAASQKADEMARALEVQLNSDTAFFDAKALFFLDEMKKWLDTIMVDCVRKNTLYGYQRVFEERISPFPPYQKLLLRDITPRVIQEHYNYLKQKGYSASTIEKTHANISKFLNYCVDMEMIDRNPATRVSRPKKDKKSAGRAYSQDETHSLLHLFELNKVMYPIVALTLYLGLRRSEICGLQWKDIDFDKQQIHIQNTAVPLGGQTVYSNQTKTKSSDRILPMSQQVKDILLTQKMRKEKNKDLLGSEYLDTDYVCVWEDGHCVRPDYISRTFKKTLLEAQKDGSSGPIYRFHDLRHTLATTLLHHNVDLKTIQDWMGHSSIEVTTNIYLHSGMEAKRKAAEVTNCFHL